MGWCGKDTRPVQPNLYRHYPPHCGNVREKGISRDLKGFDIKGIYVMLDFHQDLWSEKYCGEGAPDWAAIHDPDSRFPKPLFNKPYTVNEKGHPSAEDCAKHDW